MFKLQFDTDNEAFADFNRVEEITAILVHVEELVQRGAKSGPISDSNGNKIGSWQDH